MQGGGSTSRWVIILVRHLRTWKSLPAAQHCPRQCHKARFPIASKQRPGSLPAHRPEAPGACDGPQHLAGGKVGEPALVCPSQGSVQPAICAPTLFFSEGWDVALVGNPRRHGQNYSSKTKAWETRDGINQGIQPTKKKKSLASHVHSSLVSSWRAPPPPLRGTV